MQRLATTVAIAAWIGFLGIFALLAAASALAPDLIVAAAAMPWPQAVQAEFGGLDRLLVGLPAAAALPVAVTCLALVLLFARGLVLLHSGGRAKAARGETAALVGLALVAVLAGAVQLTGVPLLPIDPAGGLVWLAVALSVAAVTFDRLVAVDSAEEERAEADFQASLRVLAERMGRQAALYTMPEIGPANAGKDRRP